MENTSLAITTEYVRCFLAFIGKGIWWPAGLRLKMAREALDPQDVIYVLTHGDVTEAEKETAHGTTMCMIGHTCDDVLIRVKFWSDPNQMEFRVLDVERI